MIPPAPRVFISYARTDLDIARQLRDDLIRAGLPVWHDLKDIGTGQWWSQIEEAIAGRDSIEHVVLIVSPAALASKIVEREWRLARRGGKTISAVIPRKYKRSIDFAGLPAWMRAQHFYDLGEPKQQQKIIELLLQPGQQPKRPMMAPPLPEGFIHRTEEFAQLKSALLSAEGDAVAITAALRGAGGFGKTVLATALARDDDIQDAFYDGVLWVTLGENPSVPQVIANLINALTNERVTFSEAGPAANRLKEVLEHRRCLLIIDDAWQEGHLRPFLDGAASTTRLVTTRRDDIVPGGTVKVVVDAMTVEEAVALLAYGLAEVGAAERASLATLATERLGEWPILLQLVNGFLRARIRCEEALGQAIGVVTERLNWRGLVAFDRALEKERAAAVDKTVGVGLELLAEFDKTGHSEGYHAERYGELAVFPEDAAVPIATIARLWGRIGEINDDETEELLERLYGLALLQMLDLKRRTVRLHDVMRQYLVTRAGPETMKVLHRQLVSVYGGSSVHDLKTPEERRYVFEHMPMHLHEAGEHEALGALLLNPKWMQDKLDALESPLPLIADYERFATGQPQNLVGRTLRLTAGICARDPRQLIPQLLGRLMHSQGSVMANFLDATRRQIVPPALITQRPSLTPPSAETVRLEGHSGPVNALCLLPDGRLASGSYDRTVRMWDVKTGAETGRFEGDSNVVAALCALPDGRLASGSWDKMIRLWDVTTGTETGRLEGHSNWITALYVVPDGRLASGSWDNTIRLWDVKTGAETARLKGEKHPGEVVALCALPGGLLASGSGNTIWLWDVTSGAETARLEGHTDRVKTLHALPDGRLASGSEDSTIRLWDVKGGAITALLEGHTGSVNALCVLPDGLLASGGADKTIRLWDVKTGAEMARLEGHSEAVYALCLLPDRRLASGCGDEWVRLWNIKTDAKTARLDGHSSWVDALCLLPDGRLASGSRDKTIRLWDVITGTETDRLEGHSNSITALWVLPDGRLASGSYDRTIRLWGMKTGAETASLAGHSDVVDALCLLPDGRLASGSRDKTIRLWDVTTGTETGRLEGHSNSITALWVLPDGRLASGSHDRTIRLWDVKIGAETARLEGHEGSVRELCLLPDGQLASGSEDNTIRLWDVKIGAEAARLEGHEGSVTKLLLLPDGRLASGSYDKTIRLWDVKTGAETARLEGHSNLVTALCVLLDGRLASSSWDHTNRLWDIATAREIANLEVDTYVTCLAALSDGRLVAGDRLGRLHWLEIVE